MMALLRMLLRVSRILQLMPSCRSGGRAVIGMLSVDGRGKTGALSSRILLLGVRVRVSLLLLLLRWRSPHIRVRALRFRPLLIAAVGRGLRPRGRGAVTVAHGRGKRVAGDGRDRYGALSNGLRGRRMLLMLLRRGRAARRGRVRSIWVRRRATIGHPRRMQLRRWTLRRRAHFTTHSTASIRHPHASRWSSRRKSNTGLLRRAHNLIVQHDQRRTDDDPLDHIFVALSECLPHGLFFLRLAGDGYSSPSSRFGGILLDTAELDALGRDEVAGVAVDRMVSSGRAEERARGRT